jgi:hypothetical protein
MRLELLLVALLILTPAAYAWWSGRRILRSIDDPAFAELLRATPASAARRKQGSPTRDAAPQVPGTNPARRS